MNKVCGRSLGLLFVVVVVLVVIVCGKEEGRGRDVPLWSQPHFNSRHTSFTPLTSLSSEQSENSTFQYYETLWTSNRFLPITPPIVSSSGYILLLTSKIQQKPDYNRFLAVDLTCVEPDHGKTVYSLPVDLSFLNNHTSFEPHLLSHNFTHWFELKLSPSGNTLYLSLTILTQQATYHNVLTFNLVQNDNNIESDDVLYQEDEEDEDIFSEDDSGSDSDSEDSEDSDSESTSVPYFLLSSNSTVSLIDVRGVYPTYGVLTPLTDSAFILTRTYSFSLYFRSSLFSSYSLHPNSSISQSSSFIYNTAVSLPLGLLSTPSNSREHQGDSVSTLKDIAIYAVYISDFTQTVVKTVITSSGGIEYYWSYQTIFSPMSDARIIVDEQENVYVYYRSIAASDNNNNSSVLYNASSLNDRLLKLDQYKSVVFNVPFAASAENQHGGFGMFEDVALDAAHHRIILRRYNSILVFNSTSGEFLWTNTVSPNRPYSDATLYLQGISIDAVGNLFSTSLTQTTRRNDFDASKVEVKNYFGILLLNPSFGTVVFNQSLLQLGHNLTHVTTNASNYFFTSNRFNAIKRSEVVIAKDTLYIIFEQGLLSIAGSHSPSNNSVIVTSSSSNVDGFVPRPVSAKWVYVIVIVAGVLTISAIVVAIALVLYFKRDSLIRNPQYYRLDNTDEDWTINNDD